MSERSQDPRQQWLLEQPTLREAVRWYVTNTVAHKRSSTQKTYEWILDWWVSVLPDYPSAADVMEKGSELVQAGAITPATFNMRRRILSRALKMAQTKWRLLDQFTAHVPAMPEAAPSPRGLADPAGTFPKLLAVMPDARAKAFIGMQRWMGLRVSETRGLEPVHIDTVNLTVRVLQQRTSDRGEAGPLKTDTSAATMPMHPSLVELLRQAARDSMRAGPAKGACKRTYVFGYYRRETDAMMEDLRRVSPEDFPRRVVGERGGNAWHVFRHTFGTDLVNRGLPVHKVQALMRHKHISTTQTYIGCIRGRVVPGEDLRGVWAEMEAEQAAGASVPQVARPAPVEAPAKRREDLNG